MFSSCFRTLAAIPVSDFSSRLEHRQMLLVCLWLVGLKKQQYIVFTAVRNKFSLNRTSASLTGIISTEYIDNVINEHYFVFVHLNTITEKTNNMVLPSFCVRVFQYHYRED